MSSVSSTSSSLGNTALRGFGGLASGIDRDALIEKMTASTTSKITSKKQAMTKLEWKRDAYRSISNKIIDLQDNYLSYSATKSLKNSDFFAKNQVSVQGDPDYTKYISATGNADTASRVSVLGVKQLATSATLTSGEKGASSITLGGISASNFETKKVKTSNLSTVLQIRNSQRKQPLRSPPVMKKSWTVEKQRQLPLIIRLVLTI